MNSLLMPRLCFCLVAAAVAFTASAAETTLLAERFAANKRLASELPTTTAWYATSATGITDSAAGSLALGSSSRTLIAYFAPTQIAVGESLTVNFTFTGAAGSNTGNNNFRFGVFSSGETAKIVADEFTVPSSGYTGYLFAVSAKSDADGSKLYHKNGGGTVTSTTGGGGKVGNNGGKTAFSGSNTYTAELTITRTSTASTGVTLSFIGDGFTNYSESWTDTDGKYSSFNSFIIGTASNNVFSGLTLHSVDITKSNIPESSTIAAALGVGMLLAAVGFRRR